MAKGRKAHSSERKKEGRSTVGRKPWRAGRDSERGQREKGEEMEREEKQGTYFPVYPNLRDAKRLKSETERQRKKKSRGGNKS